MTGWAGKENNSFLGTIAQLRHHEDGNSEQAYGREQL
jgi:hypothetical protein